MRSSTRVHRTECSTRCGLAGGISGFVSIQSSVGGHLASQLENIDYDLGLAEDKSTKCRPTGARMGTRIFASEITGVSWQGISEAGMALKDSLRR